jgi:glycosyltransferase involved in cell wall biosynthesis
VFISAGVERHAVFSIQIPALHGKHLREVLESIRSQSLQEYEVVVVNSGGDDVSDLIREFGFREIRRRARLLEARYLANLYSRGEYALLLDETRYLRKDALRMLSSNLHDMVIIGEREVGNSIWTRLAQLDKDNIMNCNAPEAIRGFALPRLFRRDILSAAMERLRAGLGDAFEEVVFPDHELIYYEASKISGDLFVLKEELIYHRGDEDLRGIARKYHRYGKSLRILKGTPYSFMTSISRKRRTICEGGLGDRLMLNLLYLARTLPFVLGYLLG